MSSGRRVLRPVRQLSLQQTTPRRQHIRRQRSADDEKSLQIYTNPISRSGLVANVRNGTEKPKVRIAWDDRRERDSVNKVEVVARQIPGRSRPSTGRCTRSYTAIDKASILYSRQELAERLRLAWKHREENKANIDVFLAYGTVEERCESELSMSAPPTSLQKKAEAMEEERERTLWNETVDRQRNYFAGGTASDRSKDPPRETQESADAGENSSEPDTVSRITLEKPTMNDKGNTTENVGKIEEENMAEKEIERPMDTCTNPSTDHRKKTCINIDCTSLHNFASHESRESSKFSSLKPENATIPADTSNDVFSSAKQKRASFHSGTNRAFLVPMIERPSRESTDRMPPTKPIESKPMQCDKFAVQRQFTDARSPMQKSAGLVSDKNAVSRSLSTACDKARRTNSAPPQRRGANVATGTRVQVNIVIDTPGLADASNKPVIAYGAQDKTAEDAKDAGRNEEDLTKISRTRSIRSAPLKRRSKNGKRRLFASEWTGKEEDDGGCRNRCGGRTRVSVDAKTSDVVTMVSLVSSADSDSDVENSLGDDKLINELRSKLPTTSIIKTSIGSNSGIAKKPIKSVSFQRDSFDEDQTREPQLSTREEKWTVQPGIVVHNNRGNGSNDALPRKPNTPDVVVAISVPVLIPDVGLAPEAPLTDREKRCLAVPIGDLHDKKRKLLRTRSTPSRPTVPERMNIPTEAKEQKPQITLSRTDLVLQLASSADPLPKTQIEQVPKEMLTVKEVPQSTSVLPSEPQFQTIKEKECWHLYKRMCDKGVCVSFDTVLRGMLTPTEYRLRQKEIAQDLQ